MIQEHGIRCAYHGWQYDLEGRCLETPAERPESKLKDRIRIAGYSVQELGGLIWAYLGERPEPLLPRFEYLVGEQYDHDVTVSLMPCNWLQIAENNVDPHHVEYLHMMYTNYRFEQQGRPPVPMKHHAKVGFDVFEHGIIKRRLWEGDSEDSEEWRIGHPQIWPGTLLVTYPNGVLQAQLRVPQDDTHTVIYWYNCRPRLAGQAKQ
jgi:5,5'-dehydrodivanillate O-demethylase